MKKKGLLFHTGKHKGQKIPLEEEREIIVGRGREADILLNEKMISRKHASITVSDGAVHLRDLGSSNGIFLNGNRVYDEMLGIGDRILVGASIMELIELDKEEPIPDVTLLIENDADFMMTSTILSKMPDSVENSNDDHANGRGDE